MRRTRKNIPNNVTRKEKLSLIQAIYRDCNVNIAPAHVEYCWRHHNKRRSNSQELYREWEGSGEAWCLLQLYCSFTLSQCTIKGATYSNENDYGRASVPIKYGRTITAERTVHFAPDNTTVYRFCFRCHTEPHLKCCVGTFFSSRVDMNIKYKLLHEILYNVFFYIYNLFIRSSFLNLYHVFYEKTKLFIFLHKETYFI